MSGTRARRTLRPGLAVWPAVLILLVLFILGWLLVRYLRRERGVTVGGPSPPGETTTARRRGLFDMPVKPTPMQMTFEGCPPEGDNVRMGELNRLKNRVDDAASPRVVPFDSVFALPWPPAATRGTSAGWPAAVRAAIERYQGIPVAIEGYLANARESGPESPNCHGADNPYQDWHVWLSATPGTNRTRSIVVEATPRVRARHPGWTLAKLRRIARDSTRVRVTGWLMFDPEHPEQLGRTRGTIWEIHPITRIEVSRAGRWTLLDSVSASTRSSRR